MGTVSNRERRVPNTDRLIDRLSMAAVALAKGAVARVDQEKGESGGSGRMVRSVGGSQ